MRGPGLLLLRWLMLSFTAELAIFGRWISEASLRFMSRHPNGVGLFVGTISRPIVLAVSAVARAAGRCNERLRRRWHA
ncbi:MAG: hypothetical protein JSR82_03220 [Verrucomicrobia bacterium]|nr:hypothetical protein [Verrucomicrobiota bacterium]